MGRQILKSKYEKQDLLVEDLLTYRYMGQTHYSKIPVLIFEYKEQYLNPEVVRSLIKICETLVQVKHDSILSMLDYYYDGKRFYTIHEHIEGLETLEGYLSKENNWDVKTLWGFSTQLLGAQIKIESLKLVSGSLTLSGIGVTPDGRVKLISPSLPVEIYKHVWDEFKIVEDCLFFPPEFVQFKRYGIQSDIYSFGVLLFLFFTRNWPYPYTLKVEVLKKAFLGKRNDFVPVSASIPSRLRSVVETCLQADPRQRFNSFMTLVKAYRGEEAFMGGMTSGSSGMQEALEKAMEITERRRQSSRLKAGVLVAGVVIFITACYLFFMSFFKSVPEYIIPDVVGLDQIEAEQLIASNHLRSIVAGARIHPHYEKGIVIETKPRPGRTVKHNRTIRIFISKGVGAVLVPDLVGRSKDQADVLLGERGLQIEALQEDYSTLYQPGVIIEQIPSPNALMGPSDNIRVIISKGYPIDIVVEKAKGSFFRKKEHLRRVKTSFSILKAWSPMEVSYYFTYEGKKEKIYSDLHQPGESITLDFELEESGVLEVYFDVDLGFSKVIEDDDPSSLINGL